MIIIHKYLNHPVRAIERKRARVFVFSLVRSLICSLVHEFRDGDGDGDDDDN